MNVHGFLFYNSPNLTLMKKLILVVLLSCVSILTFAQSKSFQTLRDHFIDKEDVHSFSISGFLCRTALSIALSDEEEWQKMTSDIDQIRFIVIPKEEFGKQNLSVNGFKNYLVKDSFEEMMSVRDKGDHVTFFHRLDSNKKNRYFVLVEDNHEVVAIEMKGYIDPELFKDGNNRITLNNR